MTKDEEKHETTFFDNFNNELEITSNIDYKGYDDPSRRELTEIIELGEGECNLTTAFNSSESLPSQRNSNNTFYGVVFRLTARQALDILTIQFETEPGRRGGPDDTGIPVEVYTRLGGFRSYYDSPDGWTLIANTTALPTPYSRGNIIPQQDFRRITMGRREERSFYINTPTERAIYAGTRGDLRFGNRYAQNEQLQNIVGYALDGPTFNGTAESRLFHGEIYYSATVPCEEADDVLEVDFQWFVNEQNAPGVMIDLVNEYVIGAVTRAMRDDARFVQYQNFYGLNFLGAESMGYEFKGTCPFSWDGCARVVTTARLQHLPAMNVPQLHIDVLQLWGKIDTSSDEDVFEVGYYGPIGIVVDYWITLDGVPAGVEMDEAMVEYFEDRTTRFLRDATQGAITGVRVRRQIMAGISRRNRDRRGLRRSGSRKEELAEERRLQFDLFANDGNGEDGDNVSPIEERNVSAPVDATTTTTTNTNTMDTTNTNIDDEIRPNTTADDTDLGPPPPSANIFLENLQNQLPPGSGRGSFSEVRVTIYGLYKASSRPEHPHSHRGVDMVQVRNILESAFSRNEAEYVIGLRRGVYEPGRMSDEGSDRFDYFHGINGASVRVIPDSLVLPPTRSPTIPPMLRNTPAPSVAPLPEREAMGLPYHTAYYLSLFFVVVGSAMCLCLVFVHCKNCRDEKHRLGVLERRAQQKVDKLRRQHSSRRSEFYDEYK